MPRYALAIFLAVFVSLFPAERFPNIIVRSVYDNLASGNFHASRIQNGGHLFSFVILGFSQYMWVTIIVFIFLITQFILIIYLVKLNRRQKEMVKQKVETENIYREVVREDRLTKMIELTASLSHELNQPLTAILYNAQAGKRFLQSGKIDVKQAEQIFDFIIEDDKRAGSIISSVRSLMKLENREKENVNVWQVVRETIAIFNSEAISNNVDIKTSLEVEPVWVFGDKIQLQQVVLNFLRNALNAMENNQSDKKLMNVILTLHKNSVTVTVSDTGPGIDPAIKEKLFKAFVTNSQKGFGIGLALSRSIIEKHNGEIWADNLPEGGAEFSFRLKTVKNG